MSQMIRLLCVLLVFRWCRPFETDVGVWWLIDGKEKASESFTYQPPKTIDHLSYHKVAKPLLLPTYIAAGQPMC